MKLTQEIPKHTSVKPVSSVSYGTTIKADRPGGSGFSKRCLEILSSGVTITKFLCVRR